MAKASKIAARMADKVISRSGALNKSAGTRQAWVNAFLPIADAIVMLDKAVSRNGRSIKRLNSIYEKCWQGMPDTSASEPDAERIASRLVSRRMQEFDAQRWHADLQKVNGNAPAPGVKPGEYTVPEWHPERGV